jgi:cystathionine beta-lyase
MRYRQQLQARKRRGQPKAKRLNLAGQEFSASAFDPLRLAADRAPYRTATKWAPGGPALRLPIGLENVADLKADLERGFAAFNAG